MSKISDKTSIARLVHICAAQGVKHVVISPGSRNAPLTISFAEDERFDCINIPDERVAAFYALGIAQLTGLPAIICCTSGSAALNYAPAIAEAYHQKLPMIVLTADRPVEWIDQRAGQTMRQKDVYHNYIKKSFEIVEEAQDPHHIWYNDRIVNEAINTTTSGTPGPVHINVPLREPLYNMVDAAAVEMPKIIRQPKVALQLESSALDALIERWCSAKKILVIAGQGHVDEVLRERVDLLAQDARVVVLTETTSNLYSNHTVSAIDRVIEGIAPKQYKDFAPDLLITFGAAIVSKKIRFMLRQMSVADHWQVDPYDGYVDTYQHLTQRLCVGSAYLFMELGQHLEKGEHSDYKKRWTRRDEISIKAHGEYLARVPWSDIAAMDVILNKMPSGVLQTSSSTPVRYLQLFPQREDVRYYCNRGLSGIDGCTSTAMGFAAVTTDHVTLITGDLSFFYDSNALWHHHIPNNLTIIMINNEGGNIFRYVKGPDQSGHLEQHFEATHTTKAEHIAKAHNIAYQAATNRRELSLALEASFDKVPLQCSIIEIFTPREQNITFLKEYFQYIRKSI